MANEKNTNGLAAKRRRLEEIEEEEKIYYNLVEATNPFFGVVTWSDLCAVNVRFLKGEISETYYHLGPVDEETRPLLPDLILLNQRGFYTTCGQPGLEEPECKQKAFIDGFVKDHDTSDKLVEFLNIKGEFDYITESSARHSLRHNLARGTKRVELTSEYHEDTKRWKRRLVS